MPLPRRSPRAIRPLEPARPVGVKSTTAGLRRTSWRARTREGRFALALLAPSIIVVFGIVIYPILKTLYTSFYSVNTPFSGHFPFVGLRNYTFALGNSEFWSAVERTAYFTIVSTGLELMFGMGIALLLYAPLRGRWLFRTIVVLPWALPTIVNGAMWRYFFNAEYGVVNAVLTQLGITHSYHAFLSSPFAALNIVILADVWKNTSLVAFFLLAGLTTIPRELYEAARVDGYGPVGAFFHITLPLLRPVIVVVLVLRTIEAFKVFDIIYVMTGGGPANGTQSIAFYTYQRAFSDEFFGYGSALAYLIVLFILALAVIYIRALRSDTYRTA
jgi:multiple sugar transport system permease protein/N,N'-diacetylchitobiose transport system permease protein